MGEVTDIPKDRIVQEETGGEEDKSRKLMKVLQTRESLRDI